MSTSDPTHTLLLGDILSILKSNKSISHLINTITVGTFREGKGYVAQNGISITNLTSWIRLVKLNKVLFKRIIRHLNDYGYYRDYDRNSRSNMLVNMTSALYKNGYSSRNNNNNTYYMGVNLDTNVKIDGYHFNICDIFNTVSEDGYGLKRIYKLLFISEKNYLVGFIDSDCFMYLDWVLLEKIRDKNQQEFASIVKKIMQVYSNANVMFFDINLEHTEKSISDTIFRKLLTTLNSDYKDASIIKLDNVDIFSTQDQIDNYINKVSGVIKSVIDNIISKTSWGGHGEYSYSNIIHDIMNNRFKQNNEKMRESFMSGLMIGSKLENIGWVLSDKVIDHHSTICWEKDVDITPNVLYYNHEEYIINNSTEDWKNPFHISKLFVTSDGVMYCEGSHPNVSSGKVCMGDISGKITFFDIESLQKNLLRCESLLYTINYDSAYYTDKREELIQHSTKCDRPHNDDGSYVAQGAMIQDVSFEDDSQESVPQEPEDNEFESSSIEMGEIHND